MFIKVIKEAGYEEALLGLSLSYYDRTVPICDWDAFEMYESLEETREFSKKIAFWTNEKFERAERMTKVLAFKSGGHNKFLESIQVWLFVQASRDFWQEFDTYRVGITKQSASTMHTLDKRQVEATDFHEDTASGAIVSFSNVLEEYKDLGSRYYRNITFLKKNLPEGWLQERLVCTNYKVLQHIYAQRKSHRLKDWRDFCGELLKQVEYPEFIEKDG